MRNFIPLCLIASLAFAAPAMGQDFLKPLEDFVEELMPREAPPPRRDVPAPTRPVAPVAPVVATPEPPVPRPRPEERDEPEMPVEAPVAEEPEVAAPPVAPKEEPVAEAEPGRVYQTACPALLSGAVTGKMLPPIAENMCGTQSPLEITALNISGRTIELTSPLTTNCSMATALVDWAGEVDAYARAALESEVAALQTGTSYICRNRVGDGNGFVSEHGFANAVDLVGFTLADGRSIAVKDNWLPADAPEGRLLRQSHGAACGRFTTVLGPEANEEHEDHLHLDLGCHGQTCTAQICE